MRTNRHALAVLAASLCAAIPAAAQFGSGGKIIAVIEMVSYMEINRVPAALVVIENARLAEK